MKVCIIIILLIIFPVGLFAEVPELIGIIKSDTNLTQFGYRIVPLGDQNNDGYDDFMTWGFQKSAFIFFGGNPPDSLYDLRIDSVNNKFNNIGDINGDNFDDFCIGGANSIGWKLNLYYGGDILDENRDLWFGLDTLRSIGYSVYCNDINQNGTPELISYSIWGYIDKAVLLYELDDIKDSIPDMTLRAYNLDYPYDYDGFGEAIISGDFNADSIPDIALNFRPRNDLNMNGEVWFYWGGIAFDTIPDMIIRMPREYTNGNEEFGQVLENLGDVNGDGYEDIYAGTPSGADSLSYIYYGGPHIDTVPDVIITQHCTNARNLGDINNDGYVDLITSYPSPISSLGRVYIYLGGKDMDSIPDVILTESAIPGYQDYWGNDVSGIGDVNGDGIDDFAFSAIMIDTVCCRGVVYIYSGWQDPVDVEYEYQPIIPENFQLHQNYPNPFNQSTVIEFEIPTRQIISLGIYDILGRQIHSLISGSMTAGRYSLIWDGCDKTGSPVSSGIYIYRLKTESAELSKKMILLK